MPCPASTDGRSDAGRKRRRLPAADLYGALHQAWGPQSWWPANTPWEMMVGAILTQNTAWINVEKAIDRLRRENCLTVRGIFNADPDQLAEWIRPSGYFNLKARRLRALSTLVVKGYGGSEARLLALPTDQLRTVLLAVWGVGPETADSIILYAAGRAVFVVDAYTRRFMERHGWLHGGESYDEVADLFTRALPEDAECFNEFHALIVRLGKEHCRTKPICDRCPLQPWLPVCSGLAKETKTSETMDNTRERSEARRAKL